MITGLTDDRIETDVINIFRRILLSAGFSLGLPQSHDMRRHNQQYKLYTLVIARLKNVWQKWSEMFDYRNRGYRSATR